MHRDATTPSGPRHVFVLCGCLLSWAAAEAGAAIPASERAALVALTSSGAGGPELGVSERPPDADAVVALYEGAAPGSEGWAWKEQVSLPPWGGRGGRLVRNVVQPTLTVFQPPNKARSARTGVIVAPGGGFRFLSIDSEGYDVARALAARGVTAIVLKYRLEHTADDEEAFRRDAAAFVKGLVDAARDPDAARRRAARATRAPNPASNPGIADGLAAVRYVRAHAASLGVDPQRVGIMGFSAGGLVTHGVLLNFDADSRPAFAGPIYAGVPDDVQWRPDTPPVFLAVAADDFLVEGVLSAFRSLRAARLPVELHVYNKGGHGFGMAKLGLTTDLWLDEFSAWLASLGFLTAP